MDYTATLGPLVFHYVDAAHAVLQPFEAAARFAVAETEVATVEEDGRRYLVIDHRARPMAPARAEFWATTTSGEAPVDGLFVLADSATPGRRADFIGNLASLADLLSGAKIEEYAPASGS